MSQSSFNEYKMPISEVDVPLDSENDIPITSISSKDADELEKLMEQLNQMNKHKLKIRGFHLIIGCLVSYFLIVVLDSILMNVFDWETSTLVTSFVELLKFLVSTLIGYVFSEIKKNNE